MIKHLSDPGTCSLDAGTGLYYLDTTDPDQQQALEDLTSTDVLIVDLHLALAPPNVADAATSLDLECNVVLSQQGSFVLFEGVSELLPLRLRGTVSGPQNAFIHYSPYPGGMFRFDTDDQSSRQVVIEKCTRINAKWFGIPNVEAPFNRNAWLLRKCLLAAEAIHNEDPPYELLVPARPVYMPPNRYEFRESVLPLPDPPDPPLHQERCLSKEYFH